jgi:ABC-2 type transport system ATP-binding protein
VIIIDRGQIVAMDTTKALRDRLQRGARLFVRVSDAPSDEVVRRAIAGVAGVATVEPYTDGYAVSVNGTIDVRPRLSATLVNEGWNLVELRPLAMSLEDIFIELTARQPLEVSSNGSKEEKRRRARA